MDVQDSRFRIFVAFSTVIGGRKYNVYISSAGFKNKIQRGNLSFISVDLLERYFHFMYFISFLSRVTQGRIDP